MDVISLRFEAVRWARLAVRLERRLMVARSMRERATALADREEARLTLDRTGEIDI